MHHLNNNPYIIHPENKMNYKKNEATAPLKRMNKNKKFPKHRYVEFFP